MHKPKTLDQSSNVPEFRELCDAVNRHERRAVKARQRRKARKARRKERRDGR